MVWSCLLGVAPRDEAEWEDLCEEVEDFLCECTSVMTGLICLALLATVLEYSLLVGDRVALRDLQPVSMFSLPGDTDPLLTELHLALPPALPPLSLQSRSRVVCLSTLFLSSSPEDGFLSLSKLVDLLSRLSSLLLDFLSRVS